MAEIINIHINCPASPVESYGQIGIELARHFTRRGIHANIISPMAQTDDQDDEVKAITAREAVPTNGGIYLSYPTNFGRFDTEPGKRLAITMFESTRIPAAWVPILNDVDATVTPCQWCKDVFIDNGVVTPITVAALGINPVYQYIERTEDRPFTFYACLDRGKRKGGFMAARAFKAAFGGSPDYRLIMKTRRSAIPISFTEDGIDVVAANLSPAELHQLYGQCDVCIAPARGEGFGLIPREAAATGCITLATGYSGLLDDINVWGIPIPYRLVDMPVEKTGELAGLELGQWAQPDFDELVAMLRRVSEYRDMYRAIAKRAAPVVHELYSWGKFADKVLEVWRGL